MKTSITAQGIKNNCFVAFAAILALLAPGCFLFESFESSDSLGNATERTWRVDAQFNSGKHESYEQAAGRFVGFSKPGKHAPMPLLTNFIISSEGGSGKQYSFNTVEISKLRSASDGKLKLVIYDDGLACLPPVRSPQREDYPETHQEYLQLLHRKKLLAITWTRHVLSN